MADRDAFEVETEDDTISPFREQLLHETSSAFGLSISDDKKIGFFSLDRCTQTETTEIVKIKEISNAVGKLVQDAGSMRKDLNFIRNLVQAEFEAKMQQKANDLYMRINEKLTEVERSHVEKVNTLRRAYKQQLCDAITNIHSTYVRELHNVMHKKKTAEKAASDATAASADENVWKIRELKETIHKNEMMIAMLQTQIASMQSIDRGTGAAATKWVPEEPMFTEEEVNKLKVEIKKLESQVDQLQEKLDKQEERSATLAMDVELLQRHLKDQVSETEKYQREKDEMKDVGEKLRQQQADQARKQLEAMEKEVQSMKTTAEKSAQHSAKTNKSSQQASAQLQSTIDSMQEHVRKLNNENAKLEELLAKERQKQLAAAQKDDAMEAKLRKEIERLLADNNRLRKDVERINKIWEKKFAILQQSLHALKDESYLRQTLQRQASQLHQAFVTYASDQPRELRSGKYNGPTVIPGNARKPMLPEISRSHNAKSPNEMMSYTVSVPSRATVPFSPNDDQVMEGDMALPAGIQPLPSPPPPAREIEYLP